MTVAIHLYFVLETRGDQRELYPVHATLIWCDKGVNINTDILMLCRGVALSHPFNKGCLEFVESTL